MTLQIEIKGQKIAPTPYLFRRQSVPLSLSDAYKQYNQQYENKFISSSETSLDTLPLGLTCKYSPFHPIKRVSNKLKPKALSNRVYPQSDGPLIPERKAKIFHKLSKYISNTKQSSEKSKKKIRSKSAKAKQTTKLISHSTNSKIGIDKETAGDHKLSQSPDSSDTMSAQKALDAAKRRVRKRKRQESKRKLKEQKEKELKQAMMQQSAEEAKLAIMLAKKRIHDRYELEKEQSEIDELDRSETKEEEQRRIEEAVALAQRRVQIISIQNQAKRRWSLDNTDINLRYTEIATTNVINASHSNSLHSSPSKKSIKSAKSISVSSSPSPTKKSQKKHRKNSAATRKLTFRCNRCPFLQDIMKEDGWVRLARDSKLPADFTFWASNSIQTEKRGALSQLPRVSTMLMDNKKSCYILLESNGLSHLQPPTFLTYEECIAWNSSQDKENKKDKDTEKYLWFLKKNGASCQKGVEVFGNLKDLKLYYDKLENPHNWIIQREIKKPYLINGCKTTLRIYALITGDKKIYIYYKGVWVICSKPYDDGDIDRQAHCDHTLRDYQEEVRRNFDDRDPHYQYIVECSRRIVHDTMNVMVKQLNDNQLSHCFHIFGYDLLFELPKMKPWLIEMNHYPSLRGTFSDGKGDSEVKSELAKDFYHFVVKPYFFRNFRPDIKCIDHWLLCTPNTSNSTLQSNNKQTMKYRSNSRRKL